MTTAMNSQEVIKVAHQPIEVSWLRVENTDPPLLVLAIKNVSQKPVVAYGLLTRFKNHDGKVVRKDASLGAKPSGKAIGPGESSTHRKRLYLNQNGAVLSTYEISVDYVAFQDGTSWGKDEMKMSATYAQMKSDGSLDHAPVAGGGAPK